MTMLHPLPLLLSSYCLPPHLMHLPIFLLTKWVHLNLFSVSSTFWAFWALTNTMTHTPSPTLLLPTFLSIPCVIPPSYSLNKFVWTHLVLHLLSEPSGLLQTQCHTQSQSTCPPTRLPSHSMCLPIFLFTKWICLNSFSVSSTFWSLWILAGTMLGTVL